MKIVKQIKGAVAIVFSKDNSNSPLFAYQAFFLFDLPR